VWERSRHRLTRRQKNSGNRDGTDIAADRCLPGNGTERIWWITSISRVRRHGYVFTTPTRMQPDSASRLSTVDRSVGVPPSGGKDLLKPGLQLLKSRLTRHWPAVGSLIFDAPASPGDRQTKVIGNSETFQLFYATGNGVLLIIQGVQRARFLEGRECRIGSTGRAIATVTGSIPVPRHSGRDSKSCTKIGEATLQFRQRNRHDEGDRKNDPIPLPCTLVDGCCKNTQIVRRNPALGRARDAFQAAQLEPHIISSQEDPIRQVYIRVTSKTWPDYPRRLTDDVVAMFTYLQRNRSQHLPIPRERAGQPGPQAENRERGKMDARSPKHHGQSQIERRGNRQSPRARTASQGVAAPHRDRPIPPIDRRLLSRPGPGRRPQRDLPTQIPGIPALAN